MRVPWVGIGTGRCGTKSLAAIVESCKNTEVGHETRQYISQWYSNDLCLTEWCQMAQAKAEEGVLVGEVQLYMLPHIMFLRQRIPQLKVVHLHRDKQATVNSHVQKLKPMFRPFDKAKYYRDGSPWAGRYPLIDAASSEQAYEFWWEMYEALGNTLTDPVFHINMEDLNNDDEIRQLFDFLEIPEEDRIIPEQRNWKNKDWVALKGNDVAGHTIPDL